MAQARAVGVPTAAVLGYARVADPDVDDAEWVPAFVVAWALEVLGWRNPAPPPRVRRCVDVITRYADA